MQRTYYVDRCGCAEAQSSAHGLAARHGVNAAAAEAREVRRRAPARRVAAGPPEVGVPREAARAPGRRRPRDAVRRLAARAPEARQRRRVRERRAERVPPARDQRRGDPRHVPVRVGPAPGPRAVRARRPERLERRVGLVEPEALGRRPRPAPQRRWPCDPTKAEGLYFFGFFYWVTYILLASLVTLSLFIGVASGGTSSERIRPCHPAVAAPSALSRPLGPSPCGAGPPPAPAPPWVTTVTQSMPLLPPQAPLRLA